MTIKGIAGFKSDQDMSGDNLNFVVHSGQDYRVINTVDVYGNSEENRKLGILHGGVKTGAPVDLAVSGSVSKVIAHTDFPAGRPLRLAPNGGVQQHTSGQLCIGISLEESVGQGHIVNMLVYSPHRLD